MEIKPRDMKGERFRVFNKQTRNRIRQIRSLLSQVEDAIRELKNKKIIEPDVDGELARFPIVAEELRGLVAFATDLWENGARTKEEIAADVPKPNTPCGQSKWNHENHVCDCSKKRLAEINRRAAEQQAAYQERISRQRAEMKKDAEKGA